MSNNSVGMSKDILLYYKGKFLLNTGDVLLTFLKSILSNSLRARFLNTWKSVDVFSSVIDNKLEHIFPKPLLASLTYNLSLVTAQGASIMEQLNESSKDIKSPNKMQMHQMLIEYFVTHCLGINKVLDTYSFSYNKSFQNYSNDITLPQIIDSSREIKDHIIVHIECNNEFKAEFFPIQFASTKQYFAYINEVIERVKLHSISDVNLSSIRKNTNIFVLLQVMMNLRIEECKISRADSAQYLYDLCKVSRDGGNNIRVVQDAINAYKAHHNYYIYGSHTWENGANAICKKFFYKVQDSLMFVYNKRPHMPSTCLDFNLTTVEHNMLMLNVSNVVYQEEFTISEPFNNYPEDVLENYGPVLRYSIISPCCTIQRNNLPLSKNNDAFLVTGYESSVITHFTKFEIVVSCKAMYLASKEDLVALSERVQNEISTNLTSIHQHLTTYIADSSYDKSLSCSSTLYII